ncbi:hypothetical protein COLO4_08775 [Corchorus olitorius]|uniref:Uncharacterized protein n=1 Tax=Corchorus olitorius TaxID=93759 RepID=A0A1R3KEP1_9ROSI|nr:hypothetical protein COLO4_08775 [Corchorus olitorius]
MASQGCSDGGFIALNSAGGRGRRRKIMTEDNFRPWSDLTYVLLEQILKNVGVIEFLMFACVCKPWRDVAIAMKQEFMAAQGPLMFFLSPDAIKYCYFYNMYKKEIYKTTLPNLSGNKCIGVTCGYLVLIIDSMSDLWLFNPFTRHELRFPAPPKPYSNVFLTSLAKPVEEFVAIAFSRVLPFFQFCRSTNSDHWTVFEYSDRGNNWRIVDLAVLNGKIYLLTTDGEIGTLNVNPQNPMFVWLDVEPVPFTWDPTRRYNHLLSSKGELYVGEFCGVTVPIEIHRLNFETKKWEKVVFEETSFLVGNVKSIGYRLPRPSTKICVFKDPNRGFYLEEMEKCWLQLGNSMSVIPDMEKIERDFRRVPWRYPSRKRRNFFVQPIWYFPHLSTKVDLVYEDED